MLCALAVHCVHPAVSSRLELLDAPDRYHSGCVRSDQNETMPQCSGITFVLPREHGGGGPSVARSAKDGGRGAGLTEFSFDESGATSQTPPPPCCAWSPSPAFAGADELICSQRRLARQPKRRRREGRSGRWESNPRSQLGKLMFYH